MLDKLIRGILVLILCLAVLQGAYLGYQKHLAESSVKTIELCVDLNDLKTMAAFEHQPLSNILDQLKQIGINSIGVFEETLPDTVAQAETYYVKGSGVWQAGNFNPSLVELTNILTIDSSSTYIQVLDEKTKQRLMQNLSNALGDKNILCFGEFIQVSQPEEAVRTLGLGMSSQQVSYLEQKGFEIIPRLWNDNRYSDSNIGSKINNFKGYSLIIFDGEEVLGWPNSLPGLAQALKQNNIKFGYVEIIKQFGANQLKTLCQDNTIRVHSISKDELKKVNKDEAITRFVRAARERGVKLIYLRPYLYPQIESNLVNYNLDYFSEAGNALKKAGLNLGKAQCMPRIEVTSVQLAILAAGTGVAALFLLNLFFPISNYLMLLFVLVFSAGAFNLSLLGHQLLMQKILAFAVCCVFPALAVITTFLRKTRFKGFFWESIFMVFNVVAETIIGAFILVGIFADYHFMMGIEVFSGVKAALLLPLLMIAFYFIINNQSGNLWQRIGAFLNNQIRYLEVGIGILLLGVLALLVARSGNFIIPVPGFEKYARDVLETLLFIRPRTKEFLVGYPILFFTCVYYMHGRKQWLWLLAALSAIAPISILNTFSHAHTPVMVSIIRSYNGLELGLIFGLFVAFVYNWYLNKQK